MNPRPTLNEPVIASAPAARILRILAKSAASSLELFDLEKVDVVDPLQFFAEKTGLVELIGQDTVQQIISVPFVCRHGARP